MRVKEKEINNNNKHNNNGCLRWTRRCLEQSVVKGREACVKYSNQQNQKITINHHKSSLQIGIHNYILCPCLHLHLVRLSLNTGLFVHFAFAVKTI